MSLSMFLARSRQCGHRGLVCTQALGLVLVGVSLHAGDPVHFSPPSSTESLPSANTRELRPESDPHLIRPGGDGPGIDVPLPFQPDALPSKRRMQEFWDRRDREKNWIFVPVSDFGGRNRSPESMFDVETLESSSRPIKGSKVMEQFWQSQDAKDQPNVKTRRGDAGSKRDVSEPGSASGPLFGQAGHGPGEKAPLDWSKLFEGPVPGEGLKSLTKDPYGHLFDQTERSILLFNDDATSIDPSRSRLNNRKDNLNDFLKLLKAQPGSPRLSGPGDPVNAAVDSTRQAINPVVSRGLRDPTETFQMQSPLGGLPNSGFGSSANSLSSFAGFGGNGLSPGGRSSLLFPSSDPASATPKPATFDFPKRKF